MATKPTHANYLAMIASFAAMTPAQLAALSRSEITVWSALIGAIGTGDANMDAAFTKLTDEFDARPGDAILMWGNDSLTAAADTRFLTPGRDRAAAPLVDQAQLPVPRAGVLKNFFVRHNAAAGDGNSVAYDVLVNGVATAITVTLATGAVGQASDLVNTVVVAQGDRVSIRAVKAAGITDGGLNVQASLEVA